LRALLSFFTVYPFRGGSLEQAARSAYLLPFVGILTGAPGAAALLFGYVAPSGVVATLALGAVLLAAGLHHADGVLDVGDALMVRGDHTRRREVLKDARAGIGGIGALFFVYAPALAALVALAEASPARAAIALLAAEAAVRSAMLLTLAFGKPAEAGSSSVPFVRSLKGWRRTAGTTLALVLPVILLLPLGGVVYLAAVSAPIVALAALHLSRHAFGGIGGDVSGATGEAARTVLLVILSATIP
jgi:adenosylcobinamide-GDP ribazoletransferase